jgi:hypothetical protein
LSYTSQFVFSGVFKFYTYRSHWIKDPFHDERLMALLVLIAIDPLFCVLYARYCRRHPFLLAAGFAILMGVLEFIFARVGAMEYPVGWGPPISIAFSFPAFLVVWRLAVNEVPLWLHVGTMAFWVAQMPDTLLQGVLWLYHYQLPWEITGNPRVDSRIVAVAYSILLQAPGATLVALRKWRHPWLAMCTGAAVFAALESAGWMSGIVVYHHWSLAGSAVLYLTMYILPFYYARLLRQRRQKPPRWKPPGLGSETDIS